MQKLWNRPATAVWSLSTISEKGVPNFNICTYVSAISLDPKLMMVAVYSNTQTLVNVAVGKVVLLQLLTEDLAPVVRVCGQLSGKQINKVIRLQKRYELAQSEDLFYFKAAAGYVTLSVEQLVETSGDHVLMVGKVLKAKNLTEKKILTTTYLREKKYIR
jgi:flavin reductase (DIM6/NTAB) family NADH-FMN oxidoreductase RutF